MKITIYIVMSSNPDIQHTIEAKSEEESLELFIKKLFSLRIFNINWNTRLSDITAKYLKDYKDSKLRYEDFISQILTTDIPKIYDSSKYQSDFDIYMEL